MKYLLATFVCALIFALFIAVNLAFGWKNLGGVIPMLMLLGAIYATWNGIVGSEGSGTNRKRKRDEGSLPKQYQPPPVNVPPPDIATEKKRDKTQPIPRAGVGGVPKKLVVQKDEEFFYRDFDGELQGPVQFEQLLAMKMSGQLAPSSPIRNQAEGVWTTAGELLRGHTSTESVAASRGSRASRIKRDSIGLFSGWLALPSIGLLLMLCGQPLQMYAGAVMLKSMPESFVPMQSMTFVWILEWIILVAIVATTLVYFSRRRSAPIWVICLLSSFVIVNFVQMIAISRAADQPIDFEISWPFVRSVIFAAIWIPYFVRSERVKRTFTRK